MPKPHTENQIDSLKTNKIPRMGSPFLTIQLSEIRFLKHPSNIRFATHPFQASFHHPRTIRLLLRESRLLFLCYGESKKVSSTNPKFVPRTNVQRELTNKRCLAPTSSVPLFFHHGFFDSFLSSRQQPSGQSQSSDTQYLQLSSCEHVFFEDGT